MNHARHLYPETHRIGVKGSGDAVALTNAINRDAIRGYFTAPWDPVVVTQSVFEALHALHTGMEPHEADLSARARG